MIQNKSIFQQIAQPFHQSGFIGLGNDVALRGIVLSTDQKEMTSILQPNFGHPYWKQIEPE